MLGSVGMNVDPDHPQEYDEIVAMIRRAAEAAPVFFKDMSYHAFAGTDEDFMKLFVNTSSCPSPSPRRRWAPRWKSPPSTARAPSRSSRHPKRSELRLRGKGAPSLRDSSGEVRGDEFVEVQVMVPHVADERTKEILRELARLNPDDPQRKGRQRP